VPPETAVAGRDKAIADLFGDILSDLGPACTGSIGVAPSGNINPEGTWPSLFEPVHGSAPDIAGKGIANPVGMIWAGQMMLQHFGYTEAADSMMKAIETALEHGGKETITPDLVGVGDCHSLGSHIAKLISNL
jgi:tartrate dehydrogenase/decarboxylase/D-malate dehydrogenase